MVGRYWPEEEPREGSFFPTSNVISVIMTSSVLNHVCNFAGLFNRMRNVAQ